MNVVTIRGMFNKKVFRIYKNVIIQLKTTEFGLNYNIKRFGKTLGLFNVLGYEITIDGKGFRPKEYKKYAWKDQLSLTSFLTIGELITL